jgi:hypothetical protein
MAVFLTYVRLTHTSHSLQLPVFLLRLPNLEFIELAVAEILLQNSFPVLPTADFRSFRQFVRRTSVVCRSHSGKNNHNFHDPLTFKPTILLHPLPPVNTNHAQQQQTSSHRSNRYYPSYKASLPHRRTATVTSLPASDCLICSHHPPCHSGRPSQDRCCCRKCG